MPFFAQRSSIMTLMLVSVSLSRFWDTDHLGSWQHKQCLAPDTLTLLTKRHAKSLTGLGIGEVFQSFDGFPRWEELNNLFCHQVAEELMAHITCHNEENSSIKILTIGALTYRDVWGYYIKGTAASNAQDISGPNYYYVDYHKSLLGDWHYCLTRIGHGIPTGIAYFEPNLSIFEPYWLI